MSTLKTLAARHAQYDRAHMLYRKRGDEASYEVARKARIAFDNARRAHGPLTSDSDDEYNAAYHAALNHKT